MFAIRVHEYGPPEVLKYEEIDRPEPGEGQVRVKIEAAGLNFIDIYHRTGSYAGQLPMIPGMEAAGAVEATGPGVKELREGDRVAYAMHLGSYADYAVIPEARAVPVPEGVSTRQAAAVMLQGATAHYLSHSTFPLQPGHTALVTAAAGGVGLLLVQMAKRRGARVIGACSTGEKAALARQAGADEIIFYAREDLAQAARRLTDGKGVDVVYESVGQATFQQSLDSLRPRGYLVLYGQSSGPVEPLDPQILNSKGSLFLTRPTLGHYVADRAELLARSADLFEWLAAGELQLRIDRLFPLAQAADAHRYMADRRTKGKVLLIPEGYTP
jgi:NADPH:quinone reductase